MRKSVPAVLVGVFALGAYAAPAYALGATNPNVTQATIAATICTPGFTATIRPPSSFTNALKAQQLAARGLPGPASNFEEDHIIPLELGGAPTDPNNLQPVPLAQAKTDDVKETALHAQVCAGTKTLAAAQAEILALKAGEGGSVAAPSTTSAASAAAVAGAVPQGAVNTGVGGGTRTNSPTELAVGGALAAAALAGAAVVRVRRRSASN